MTMFTTKKPFLAVILSLTIALSFIALIQLEKNNSMNFNQMVPTATNLSPLRLWTIPSFSNQPVIESTIRVVQPALISNSTRAQIYEFIVANPGIEFRGICNGLGIAIGTAEFHLGVLRKAGLISFFRDGKYKRFFVSKAFLNQDIKLISLLRHKTAREIIKKLALEKETSHGILASYLSITSQGLTWQMNRLKKEGIVEQKIEGIKVSYSLNQTYLQALPELLNIAEKSH